jgi:hypothetical protein
VLKDVPQNLHSCKNLYVSQTLVAHICNPTWEAEVRRIVVQASLGKKKFARPHVSGKKAGYGSAHLSSQQWQEA